MLVDHFPTYVSAMSKLTPSKMRSEALGSNKAPQIRHSLWTSADLALLKRDALEHRESAHKAQ